MVAPPLATYNAPAETKQDLDWADLPTIDLSLYGTPEGKQQLVKTLIDAVRTKGFFYVKNYNISQERVNRQFAIGKAFYDLPLEEKLKYVPDLDNGQYNGYRPAGRRDIQGGLKDQTEVYNIPKFNGDFEQTHPPAVADHIEEVETFARALHSEVLDPLHVLFALALELPEDYFTSRHLYETKSEDHLRYMKYTHYSPEDTKKIGNIWVGGHTDLGTLTLLFRQPVAALQIQDHKTGQWKWVKPQDGTITVNTCDALSFLTGGYVRSTIHRVVAPPEDQAHLDRLGLLYFARPRNDLTLSTIDSPVLKRDGFTQNEFEREGHHIPTMEEFTFKKQKWQQAKGAYQHGETIVPGFKGLHYE